MSTRTRLSLGCGALVIIGAGAIVLSTNRVRSAEPAPGASTHQQLKEGGFANPELARFDMLIGPWKVTETHFNPSGEQIATVKGTEKISWILDHHAVRRSYETQTESTAFEAVGILTYNQAQREYQGAWFDNASTSGPVTVRGVWKEDPRSFVFTLEAVTRGGAIVRYRVVEELPDEERRIATTYLLKGGELIKRLEVRYQRYSKCPPLVRPIFGE